MAAAEQDDIRRSIAALTGDRRAARQTLDGGPIVDRVLWNALAELGLTAPALPEHLGGSGAGLAEMTTIAEALAAAVAPVPITAAALAAFILTAGRGGLCETLARALATGDQIVGAVLAADGGDGGLQLSQTKDGARLSGRIEEVMDAAALDSLLLYCDGAWWAVRAEAAGVERQMHRSLDPTRPLAALNLEAAAAVRVSEAPLEQVIALGWVLLAAESLGAAQAALDLTTRYCLERRQFGEQIGRFQAVKHKLADMLVSVEGARSALFGAVSTASSEGPDPRAAQIAKAVVAAAGAQVTGEAIQLHGAIGTAWEHDLHLLMRRAKACQLMLGSNDFHLDRLSETLLQPGRTSDATANDLSIDNHDREFLGELRSWLDAHATRDQIAALRQRDIAGRQAWQAEMADAGWVGIHWPRRFGGRDATFTQQVLYHSELASRGLPPFIGNRGLSLVGPTLIVHGTPDQQARFLEPSRRGDFLWASGLSEPGSGSDLASLQTRGVVDGDEIIVTGQKTWTSGAHYSQWMYTLVRTGGRTPKHDGISCVLIPLDAPGVTIRPIRRMNGEPEYNEVFLDEVRAPLENLVGDLNEGWKVARTTLAHEHSTNFLGAQLRQSSVVERIIAQMRKREESAGIDHGIRRRVAQSWINCQLLRLHGLRNMASVVEGGQPGAEGSVLKLFGQEEERRLYELALDVRGPAGLTSSRAARAYLGARAATIGGGTSEIHRNKIAERVLGMPRDPWAED